jgi:hypothetical protein
LYKNGISLGIVIMTQHWPQGVAVVPVCLVGGVGNGEDHPRQVSILDQLGTGQYAYSWIRSML